MRIVNLIGVRLRVIFTISILIFLVLFSLFLSYFTVDSDFSALYSAACTIIDPDSHVESVYAHPIVDRYSIPEYVERNAFIYPVAAAYLLAPLALMPYYMAKATMVFINILAYLGAIIIIMQFNGASGRLFIYPLALSCFWLPFMQNLRAAQVNAILLFLVAIATTFAIRNRPVFCGIFFGIASIFKLFPIAIAIFLGIRNWRILVTSVLVFCATFLIPGSLNWFSAIRKIYPDYTLIYTFLTQFGTIWYFLYVLLIAGITAIFVYISKRENFIMLTSFAIPAVFLTMPILEYHHLTLLIYSFIYIFTFDNNSDRVLMSTSIVSALLISSSFLFSRSSYIISFRPIIENVLMLVGIFIFWVSLLWKMYAEYKISRSLNSSLSI